MQLQELLSRNVADAMKSTNARDFTTYAGYVEAIKQIICKEIDKLTPFIEKTYFPPNDYNVSEGYYTQAQIVQLLRLHSGNPQAVYFIADMLEE